MSGNSARSVGRLAFTAVGYYVGGLVGAPAVGGAIGGAIGGALFPHQLPEAYGPRLDDLSIQTSSVGIAIPIVYGTYAIAGNVIWSAPIREVSETEEVGKGSGTEQDVTTYSYFGSFAVGLCEGEIAGITRIWANESLVYDIRPQQSGETDAAFNQRMAGSTAWADYMTVYSGTETQTADPTIEAEEGAGNVPGYRGLAYIVFDGLPLADFYNRIPQLKVEVINDGVAAELAPEYTSEAFSAFDYSRRNPVVCTDGIQFRARILNMPNGGTELAYRDSLAEAFADLRELARSGFDDGGDVSVPNLVRAYGTNTFLSYPFDLTLADDHRTLYLAYNILSASEELVQQDPPISGGSSAAGDFMHANLAVGVPTWVALRQTSGNFVSGVYVRTAENASPNNGFPGYYSQSGPPDGGFVLMMAPDIFIEARRSAAPPRSPCDPCQGSYPFLAGGRYCVIGGQLLEDKDWTLDEQTYKHLSVLDISDGLVRSPPSSPSRPAPDPEFSDQQFWDDAYAAAVSSGSLPGGWTYSVSGTDGFGTYPRRETFGYTRTPSAETLSASPVPLSGIVADLCARAGLAETDISDLTADNVQGYAIGTVMAARDAIQPLRQYAQFDAAEVDGELRFVKRGGEAVVTLSAADLGAYTGDQRPDPIAVERAQDVELPRRLRLHYASTDRDYEAGEQTASRLTTGAVNVMDIEMPIAMSDTQAAQITEILLFDLWTARNGYRTTLATEHLALAPGDPVTLPVDGQQERARILSIDYAAPGLLALELARDDDGNYVSYAVGNAGSFRPGVVSVSGPTDVVLLDLPALLDSDNNPGYYAAMRGLLDGWQGASLFRSNDGGGSYTAVASASNAATMGGAVTALPDALATVWDRGNVLSVVLDSGELEGITESAVLAGGNAAALEVRDGDGATLGWEVLQFAEAAQESDGSWTLTDLLRGRKGTEWATGLHQAGDRFVLLTGPGIIRVPMESSGIGIERPHRAVTVGTSVDSASIVDYAGAGVALEPYSPVHVRGDWDGDDLVLSWIRRGRIGNAYSSGTDIPLSEETEAYEVDILAGETVLRTLASTAQSVTYTAAQQSEDWGLPVPDTFTVRVYQLSATVGRGYPAETTV